jgi:hypothetical protein
LILSASETAAAPASPIWLPSRLQREEEGQGCSWRDRAAGTEQARTFEKTRRYAIWATQIQTFATQTQTISRLLDLKLSLLLLLQLQPAALLSLQLQPAALLSLQHSNRGGFTTTTTNALATAEAIATLTLGSGADRDGLLDRGGELGALRGHERDGDERQHDLEELHLA